MNQFAKEGNVAKEDGFAREATLPGVARPPLVSPGRERCPAILFAEEV
jgi:hypothetical protein